MLLLVDSITRVAHAQREIGLAVGEPPTSKGYPPSVFALIPRLIERAGVGRNGHGSITAIYTVLAEGDDRADPIVDIARASLDGQVMLSRRLADAAMYPAIDLEGSVSRSHRPDRLDGLAENVRIDSDACGRSISKIRISFKLRLRTRLQSRNRRGHSKTSFS